jgi:uncharacterized membrane protein YvbJ
VALVKCKQCGTNMLSDAAICPGCGAPMARAESSRWVDIRKLLAEYADSEVRADNTFKGHYVLIDGIVSDVKRDLLNTKMIPAH